MARGLAFVLVGISAAVFAITPGAAADVKGSSDHPLVGRYQGSEIVGYRVTQFDEVSLVDGPFDPVQADQQKGPGFLKVEGRQVLIYYRLPQGRSSLEILRNYEASLATKGFRVLFTCDSSVGSCFQSNAPEGGYLVGNAVGNPLTLPKLGDDYVHNWFQGRGRYLLAQLDTPKGAVYASLSFGESDRGTVAVVRVVETKELDSNKITVVSANDIEKQLDAKRPVNIYGILFDFDKDLPRPESKPTMDEIAKALNARPQLRLKIVGHTDNRGSDDYNVNLSARRAKGVVAALTGQYGIAAARLSSEGAGAGAPVASNDDAAGRAKNRRVELIPQ